MALVNPQNLKKVIGAIKVLEAKVLRATQSAIRTEGELIMTASQKEVPVDNNFLKPSRFVEDRTRGSVVAILIGYSAKYALAVHEIPAPPSKSKGGRSATHTAPTKWKYLEDPMKAAQAGYSDRVAERIKKLAGT